MKKLGLLLMPLIAISSLLSCGNSKSDPLPVITDYNSAKCNNGTFVGDESEDIVVWRGIPYATQPVGKNLRWKKALPAEDNNGTFAAVKPGHIPIGPNNDSQGTAEFGEDCLVLNVYNSKKSSSKNKPVMVWVHGGGFVTESISQPLYDLSHIANQYPDVIFVAIEYREGFMGFMNFEKVPGGENYKDATNLGLLDQLEALKWINKNISAFGGDPNSVTLFGESAGASSISFLPLIDGSKGLFKRLIVQSSNIAYCDTMEHGMHVTENFLHVTGCKNMEELLKLSLNDLLEATKKGNAIDTKNMLGAANFPLLDGVVLPEDRADMYDMWESEELANIDLLIGSNRDEVKYFIPIEGNLESFTEALRWVVRKDRTCLNDEEKVMFDAFMDTLSGENELERLQQYADDMNFRAGNTNMAIRHSNAGGNTYMYYLEKPGVNEEFGVIHGTEMMYLFDNPFHHVTYDFIPMECELKYQIKEMWVNFAKTGNPSTSEHEWTKFSEDDRQTMVFSDTLEMKKDILGQRENLMMSWAERLGNGASKRFC
ncbi:MAG: carboxylesterase family protein [Bacilli bacterium]|nr:carboxylesterase family protein [Bacilli bacterium]